MYMTDDEEFTTQRLAELTLEEHFDVLSSLRFGKNARQLR